jgi:hypothetical protein
MLSGATAPLGAYSVRPGVSLTPGHFAMQRIGFLCGRVDCYAREDCIVRLVGWASHTPPCITIVHNQVQAINHNDVARALRDLPCCAPAEWERGVYHTHAYS